ncbi:MAG: nickel-responsive transcriptional regulator NikR [Elusimicrobiota bacterium]|nr:nickel-responsive transcriptional regulator NikR [Endomicrobiia bacterium]MCX7910855.1 nickel-responsive transcriptional regulator NikR [Endomicrobiia bacterium]MDW8165705.1 nickel-responsive transcriptional regulator NikR [Elusimicrobiota bacterium]
MKTTLKRFGIAIPKELLERFDKYIKEKKYKNRSEAIRDLIRAEFVKKSWQQNKEVVGVISIVYNHHKRELLDKIVDLQHNYQHLIIASQHIHLTHESCLEVILTRGKAKSIQELKDKLAAIKGVTHSTLSITSIV